MTEFGLLLPTREAVIFGDRTGDPRPLVELAVRAEEAGLDSVWAGDSLLARPRAEPLTLLAAVAARTARVRLGTAVLLAAQRNAEQLAQATATLDAVSGGRFVLGVGAGPDSPGVRRDHELVGHDFHRRASRVVDVVRRVRSLWRGTVREAPPGTTPAVMYPRPVTPGGPPIWNGGHGPRTLARTGRYFDGWFPTATSPEALAAGLDAVRTAATAAGRPGEAVSVAAYLTVTFGERAAAEAELAEHSQRYYGVPHEVVARQQGSMAGPPELVAEWLAGFVDAGAEHLCLRLGSARVDEQLEALLGVVEQLRTRREETER